MAVAFKTHTGLLIALERDEQDNVVTITGDKVKELLRTPSRVAARKYYESLKKQYAEREKAEASG
jgi:hypothetical protein